MRGPAVRCLRSADRPLADFHDLPQKITHRPRGSQIVRGFKLPIKPRPLLGEKPAETGVQDLLWAVCMLPEFQLVR